MPGIAIRGACSVTSRIEGGTHIDCRHLVIARLPAILRAATYLWRPLARSFPRWSSESRDFLSVQAERHRNNNVGDHGRCDCDDCFVCCPSNGDARTNGGVRADEAGITRWRFRCYFLSGLVSPPDSLQDIQARVTQLRRQPSGMSRIAGDGNESDDTEEI